MIIRIIMKKMTKNIYGVQGGNKNGFTENDLCKEMRKLKIKYDSTDDKERIKNYEKHLLNYFKGETHEY